LVDQKVDRLEDQRGGPLVVHWVGLKEDRLEDQREGPMVVHWAGRMEGL